MRIRTLCLWVANAFFPIIILFIYIIFVFGPDTYKGFVSLSDINSELWQMEHWSTQELTFRHINKIVNDNPDLLLLDETFGDMRKEESIADLSYIILIRKADEIYSVNDFSSKKGKELLGKMRELSKDILPPFGSDYKTSNRSIVEKIGYSVSRQYDFYFSDGSEGSVFFMPRVINFPSKIVNFALKYFAIVLLVYIFLVSYISAKVGYKVSKDFETMINIMGEISQENFTVEIPNYKKGPFKVAAIHMKNMAEKLQDSKESREALEESRDMFINTMTHDLKTPLTAIKVQVEALKDGLASEPKVFYNNIEKKVENIDQMLNELKTFSEINMASYHYEFALIPIRDFVVDVIDEWQYDVQKHNVTVRYDFDIKENDMVWIDSNQMKRVLINILSNAIKYVDKEAVIIDIVLKKVDNKTVLEIADNGPGVPESFLGEIFDLYFRVDDSRNQNKPGSGLGLAICKTIIEGHCGYIRAYNRQPSGLVFEIVFEGMNTNENITD